MKIAIIGLGLIGGSLGLNLRENKFISCVYGLDINKVHEKMALEFGLIHEIIEFKKLDKCDMIFIATPVDVIISLLKKLENLNPNTTIIELGSTKRKIIENLPPNLKTQTIFAHPMTGTENNGPKAAFKELYQNGVCVLCDSEMAGDLHQKRAVEIFSHIGMKIVFMDSFSHDARTAIISHLPHVISFSLANFVMKEEDKKNIVHLAGGSFRDMSRIAKSSPAMWSSIFEQNKDNILTALDHFQKELENCKKMIEKGEQNELFSWMQKANLLREIL